MRVLLISDDIEHLQTLRQYLQSKDVETIFDEAVDGLNERGTMTSLCLVDTRQSAVAQQLLKEFEIAEGAERVNLSESMSPRLSQRELGSSPWLVTLVVVVLTLYIFAKIVG